MELNTYKVLKTQSVFDEMNAYEKAEFMSRNLDWAACNELQRELEARGYIVKYT